MRCGGRAIHHVQPAIIGDISPRVARSHALPDEARLEEPCRSPKDKLVAAVSDKSTGVWGDGTSPQYLSSWICRQAADPVQ